MFFDIIIMQVLKAKFGLCDFIARSFKSFSKRSAFYALDGLVDKVGDIKVSQNFSCLGEDIINNY